MNDTEYVALCRDLVDRAASRTGGTPHRLMTPCPPMHEALQIADDAGATIEEMERLERAWLDALQAPGELRAVHRRSMRMIERYREELGLVDTFLKKHDLWHEYVAFSERSCRTDDASDAGAHDE